MRNREKRILRDVWSSLTCVLKSKDWGQHAHALLRLTKEESKRHNSGRPEGMEHDISIDLEAKFFAVKRVTEYLAGDKAPKAENFTHTQTSCFYAYSLVSQYREELKDWLTKNPDAWDLVTWDYARLTKRNLSPYSEYTEGFEVEGYEGKWYLAERMRGANRRYFGPWPDRAPLANVVTRFNLETRERVTA